MKRLGASIAIAMTLTAAGQLATAQDQPVPQPAPTPMQPAAEAVADPVDRARVCDERFTLMDTNGDGLLTLDEDPAIFARAPGDGRETPVDGYTRERFLEVCQSAAFERPVPEEGAPFEGANSFTEGQARDRAADWGLTDVSALVLDELGIWRGTARLDGAPVEIAIDYRGNVVSRAQ